eukprot:gene7791-8950_t
MEQAGADGLLYRPTGLADASPAQLLPSKAVSKPRELAREHLKLIKPPIGQGQFGKVWKGILTESASEGLPGYLVAAKTATAAISSSSANPNAELLEEASIMARVTGHMNVVSLVGVITKGLPMVLVVSYCEFGSLLLRLREQASADSPLSLADKLNFAVHVANGMEHLANELVVHRDLAARNVLLNSEQVAQVADFGLSRAQKIGVDANGEEAEVARGYKHGRPENSHGELCPLNVYKVLLSCLETLPANRTTFESLANGFVKERHELLAPSPGEDGGDIDGAAAGSAGGTPANSPSSHYAAGFQRLYSDVIETTDGDGGINDLLEALKTTAVLDLHEAVSAAEAHCERRFDTEVAFATAFAEALIASDRERGLQRAKGLDVRDVAAIHFYTQETEFYRAMNGAMGGWGPDGTAPLRHYLPFIRLLTMAMGKLPPVKAAVYRGMKGVTLQELLGGRGPGDELEWNAFTSCSLDSDVLRDKAFLGVDAPTQRPGANPGANRGKRFVFKLHVLTGVQIEHFSEKGYASEYYLSPAGGPQLQNEEEVLLWPGTRFKIVGINPTGYDDLTEIEVREVPMSRQFPDHLVHASGADADDADGTGANAAAAEISTQEIDVLAALLSPHIAREPVKTSSANIVGKTCEIGAHEASAADKVVLELQTITFAATRDASARIADDLRETLAESSTDGQEFGMSLIPLHERLDCSKLLLDHYAHRTLSACTLPVDADALRTLTAIVVDPVVMAVKTEIVAMCKDVRARSSVYKKEVEKLGRNHKLVYDAMFSDCLMEGGDRVAYNAMLTAVQSLETCCSTASLPSQQQQPNRGLLELTAKVRQVQPHFENLVERFVDGIDGILLPVSFRLRTKALYRMIEKAILKGPTSASGLDGILDASAELDCSSILDVFGCLIVCSSWNSMENLIKNMCDVLAVPSEGDGIEVHAASACRIKNRWDETTNGGWKDLMVNVNIDTVVYEIQVVHEKLYNSRKVLDGHKAYSKYRCYNELLAFAGESGGGGGGYSSEPNEASYDVIFSHSRDQQPFVEGLIKALKQALPELKCFYQANLDVFRSSPEECFFEWRNAFLSSASSVCILSREYLQSSELCMEWELACKSDTPPTIIAADTPERLANRVTASKTNEGIIKSLQMPGSRILAHASFTESELAMQIRAGLPSLDDEHAIVGSDAPVDILVVVDFPTSHSGGPVEPSKYIAPLSAMKDAMDAMFSGRKANIKFVTPQSIMESDAAGVLQTRIPCVCWIAQGEEAPDTDSPPVFSTALWKEHGGKSNLTVVLMKHGAEWVAGKIKELGCADRVLWISADYSASSRSSLLLESEIPKLFKALLCSSVSSPSFAMQCRSLQRFANESEFEVGCKPDAEIDLPEHLPPMPSIPVGDRVLQPPGSEILARVATDPPGLYHSATNVGLKDGVSIDLNHLESLHELQSLLAKPNRKGLEFLTVSSKTVSDGGEGGGDGADDGSEYASLHDERRKIVWAALESISMQPGLFDKIIFRDLSSSTSADVPVSDLLKLPFSTYANKRVLVWIDSRSEVQLDEVCEAFAAQLYRGWAVILTSKGEFEDLAIEMEDAGLGENSDTGIELPLSSGSLVNSDGADLIQILPDPAFHQEPMNILNVVDSKTLLKMISAALSGETLASETATDESERTVDYLQQVLVNDQRVIVRGIAPNTQFLFELRNDLVDGTLERRLQAELAKVVPAEVLAKHRWILDKAAFAGIYQGVLSQMDQLTPHQQEKLAACESVLRSHVTGPAGCGKTFVALHMVLKMLQQRGSDSFGAGTILFVGKNEALCIFFVNWIVQRLRKVKTMKWKLVKQVIQKRVRALHTSPFGSGFFEPSFDKQGNVRLKPDSTSLARAGRDQVLAFVIVDEAHHIFGNNAIKADRTRVTELCEHAKRCLLLSDISQGTTAKTVSFPEFAAKTPPGLTHVMLSEVVRNSDRIMAASLPFCRSDDLTGIVCQHGVRGPPLVPFIFDYCGDDSEQRNQQYASHIIQGLQHIFKEFPGVELHDQMVILVPNVDFRDAVKATLEMNSYIRDDAELDFVDAVEGAFPAKKNGSVSRVVLDTLESFDGMERLFVLAVGLDSPRTAEGCCGIYRAITRAHMFVSVVQEYLKDGWLEYITAVEYVKDDFDGEAEAAKFGRDNLGIIEDEAAAAAAAEVVVVEEPEAEAEAEPDDMPHNFVGDVEEVVVDPVRQQHAHGGVPSDPPAEYADEETIENSVQYSGGVTAGEVVIEGADDAFRDNSSPAMQLMPQSPLDYIGHAGNDDDDGYHESVATDKGERIKTWRKRWLVLTSDGLFQEYKAPPKSPRDAPTQTFDVAGSAMTAVDDPKAKGGKDQKYGFIIRFGTNVEMTKFIERSFHYDTEEERELWVEQYEKVLKDVHRQSLKVLPDAMPNFQRRNAVASKQGNDASNPEDDDSKPSRKFGLFGRRETKQTKLVTTLQNNAEVTYAFGNVTAVFKATWLGTQMLTEKDLPLHVAQ